MRENRQHTRYAIELDAEAHFENEWLRGRTQDISCGGFCVLAPRALPVGSVGEVRLALVFSENQFSEQLTLPALIVWCTQLRDAHQIGFKFGRLSEESKNYLSMFMQFLEGGEHGEETEHEEEEP
jgi:c-di-GMP-binding flagellar brake protein YcgR